MGVIEQRTHYLHLVRVIGAKQMEQGFTQMHPNKHHADGVIELHYQRISSLFTPHPKSQK